VKNFQQMIQTIRVAAITDPDEASAVDDAAKEEMRFAPEQIAPTLPFGFSSITGYGTYHTLIPNEHERYSVQSSDPALEFGDGGGRTLPPQLPRLPVRGSVPRSRPGRRLPSAHPAGQLIGCVRQSTSRRVKTSSLVRTGGPGPGVMASTAAPRSEHASGRVGRRGS
jgi:hypothetical protein